MVDCCLNPTEINNHQSLTGLERKHRYWYTGCVQSLLTIILSVIMADLAIIRQFFGRCNIGSPGDNVAEEFRVSTGLTSVSQFKNYNEKDCQNWVYTHNKRQNTTFIGPAVIKDLTVLMFFARYQWRREREVTLALFTDAMKVSMSEKMEEIKALKDRESEKDVVLGRVETLAGYENFMGRFVQKLSSIIGAAEVNLLYVIRPEVPLASVPMDADTEELYAIRQNGPEWKVDNKTVMNILYSAVNQPRADGQENSNRSIITWIQEYNARGDGRLAVQAFKRQYEGAAATNNREVLSKAKVTQLHYKDEAVFSFERFVSELKDAFDGCGLFYTEKQKIDMLLEKIQPTSKASDVEIRKVLCKEQDFETFTAAATYMSTKISEVFQDQIVRMRSYGSHGRGHRRISEVHGQWTGGRGRTWRGGRTGGRGGRGGRDGSRGGGGRGGVRRNGPITGKRNYINGVSVSNATRSFTGDESTHLP